MIIESSTLRAATYVEYVLLQPKEGFLFADPAAEQFNYPVSFDIRDLVPLEDVMDEMKLGPNGWEVRTFQHTLCSMKQKGRPCRTS